MLHLPIEVLVLIGNALEPSQRPRLLQVCRRLRAIFFGLVYTELHLTGRRIDLLARTIQSNPQIASMVQRLALKDLALRSYGPLDPSVGKPHFYSSWVDERVQQASHSHYARKRWRNGLVLGMGDNWGALILTLLDNLVDLHIEYPSIPSEIRKVIFQAAAPAPNPKPALQKLKKVNIDIPKDRFLNPSRDLFPFFHLPSIQSVSASGIIDNEHVRAAGPKRKSDAKLPAPKLSSVEEVHLNCTCDEAFGMQAYITPCANLKKFSFTNLYKDSFGAPRDRLLQQEFYRPLLSHKNSLEVLDLNYLGLAYDDTFDNEAGLRENFRLGVAPDRTYGRWFGSFAEFTRLTELCIRAPNLLNLSNDKQSLKTPLVDTLPRSLQSLFVSYSSDVYIDILIDGLTELVRVREERFPSLRRITVCCHEAEIRCVFSQFERIDGLRLVCSNAGLKFEMHHKDRRAQLEPPTSSNSSHEANGSEVRPHRFLERDFSSWLDFEAWLHCRPSVSF
ncbi:hypothetical protein BJY01DRAFT_99435 [Aspergillus pseudoustus]|uniref:F-box domain-containing protein n=1 Tax=Aspergillus pseudoustus TaxID=1810923 RepID=A0ABR4IYA8_9EURO